MDKTIRIKGMSGGHCAARVQKALEDIPSIAVTVSLKTGEAHVTGAITPDAVLTKAVTDAGFTVAGIEGTDV